MKTSSFYDYATPCPFTFLTAVKCKFPTDKSNASHNRTGKPNKVEKVCDFSMDPVKPLNIPNLHIFPKACHVPQKLESSNEKSLASKQSCSSSKTKSDNTNKASTYSESPPSTVDITLRSKNIEFVKAPNIVPANQKIIAPNNEKERDHSRNKENKFIGKIKKEDGKGVKNRNDIPSSVKCSRYQKNISRKDILDRVTNKTIKNVNILNHHCKDNDNTIKKSAKRKKEKPRNPQNFSTRSHREMSNRSDTLTEKVKVRKDRETTNSTTENSKCKDNNQASLHPNLKSTLLEPQNNSNSAESTGMTSQDYSEHLSDQKSTQLSEDSAMAGAKKYQKLDLTAPLLTLCTTTEESFNNLHIQQNNVEYRTSVLSPNNSNHSSNDSIIETKLSQDSLSEKLMDPMRISFREDSYSNQPEFSNLVTPNVNLIIRSKRRKQVIQQNMNSNDDYKDSKVEAKTESNPSDRLLFARELTHSIDESSAHNKPSPNRQKISDTSTKYKSMDTNDNEKEILNHSAKGSVDKSSYIADNVQTETFSCHYRDNTSLVFSKECTDSKETLYNSLNLGGGYENATRLDDISLSKKVRTMSEISLHETTSSIRTESGTEISISLRDVTCSFNKNLDLEVSF